MCDLRLGAVNIVHQVWRTYGTDEKNQAGRGYDNETLWTDS
jgi:hypothetical protein